MGVANAIKVVLIITLLGSNIQLIGTATAANKIYMPVYKAMPWWPLGNRFLTNMADMTGACEAYAEDRKNYFAGSYVTRVAIDKLHDKFVTRDLSGWQHSLPGWPDFPNDGSANTYQCNVTLYTWPPNSINEGAIYLPHGYSMACPDKNGGIDVNIRPDILTNDCLSPVLDCDDECDADIPISIGDGGFQSQQSDYAGRGRGAIQSNRYPSNYDPVRDSAFPKAFGYAWRHELEHVLIVNAEQTAATLDQSDGSKIKFIKTGGDWKPVAIGKWKLTEAPDSAGRYFAIRQGETSSAKFSFSSTGRLLSVEGPNIGRMVLQYSTDNLLQSITNANGRSTRFVHGNICPAGCTLNGVVEQLNPDNTVTKFEYAWLGFLRSVTWADGTARSYKYGFDDTTNSDPDILALRKIINEDGESTTIYADTRIPSRTGRVTYDDGSKATAEYLGDSVFRIVGLNGKAYRHTFFDDEGVLRPSSITPECASCGEITKQYTYSAAGLVDSIQDHDGSITQFTYDGVGREIKRVVNNRSAISIISTRYDPATGYIGATASPGNIVAFAYGADGRLVGKATTYTNDSSGERGFDADATGATEAEGWAFNVTGGLTGYAKTAAGVIVESTAFETNGFGDVVKVTDNMSGKILTIGSLTSDGSPLNIASSTGENVSFIRGLVGEVLETNWNGSITKFTYDLSGNLTSTLHPDGSRTDYRYDTLGRYLGEEDVPVGVLNWIFGRFLSLTGLVRDATAQDQWYGMDDVNFQDYVHAEKQTLGLPGNKNFTRKQLQELEQQWKDEGCPRGKGGKSGKGGRTRGGGRGGGGGGGGNVNPFDKIYKRMLN